MAMKRLRRPGGRLAGTAWLQWMQKRAFVSWTHSPLGDGISISSSGLVALADLSTIAKRTVLTGTSTWLDALFLAPGLHYQQFAETLGATPQMQTSISGSPVQALNLNTGMGRGLTNTATLHYLNRIGKKDVPVILDVGPNAVRFGRGRRAVGLGTAGHEYRQTAPASSKIALGLYMLGPVLTLCGIAFMIVTQDWWGCGMIAGLILARALNIWVIKRRTQDIPATPETPNQHENWWVTINGHNICLRGLGHDLHAITTGQWMRDKTETEGYLEAMAKVLVYMVAALSGNTLQSGDLTLIALLLVSSGILALSNSFTDTFAMNGKVASVVDQTPMPKLRPVQKKGGHGIVMEILPTTHSPGSDVAKSWEKGASEFEREEAATVVDSAYPFTGSVNYV